MCLDIINCSLMFATAATSTSVHFTFVADVRILLQILVKTFRDILKNTPLIISLCGRDYYLV